jgi:flagellar motor switch protein FliN/FliY
MTDYFKPREDVATETAPAQAEGPRPRFSMEDVTVDEAAATASPVAEDLRARAGRWFEAVAADWTATGAEASAQVSAVSQADKGALDAAVKAEPIACKAVLSRSGSAVPVMLLFSEESALAASRMTLGSDVKEVDDAVLEVLGQAAGRIMGSLRGAWTAEGARDIDLEDGRPQRLDAVPEGFAAGAQVARASLTIGGTAVQLSLILPAAFDPFLAAAATQAGAEAAELAAQAGRIARILKIKVPIIVEIARRRTTVREIVALKPGTVIEFDKKNDELLDVRIGRAGVGKGEAVKVGENFGLRVLDIGGVRERIQSLKV